MVILMLRKLLPVHLLFSIVLGQPTFTEHAISTSADGAYDVHAVDVDGDGDMDVLSASAEDEHNAWYEKDGYQNQKINYYCFATCPPGRWLKTGKIFVHLNQLSTKFL